jgi:hypothetical protein
MNCTTSATWNCAYGSGPPVSCAIVTASSSRRRSTIAAARRISRAFSNGGVLDHAGNAADAAATASAASLRPQRAAVAKTFPVHGLRSSNVPAEASRQRPSEKKRYAGGESSSCDGGGICRLGTVC